MLQQQPDDLDVVVLGRRVERGVAGLVREVDVGPVLEFELHLIEPADARPVLQRGTRLDRAGDRVVVGRAGGLAEDLHHLAVEVRVFLFFGRQFE